MHRSVLEWDNRSVSFLSRITAAHGHGLSSEVVFPFTDPFLLPVGDPNAQAVLDSLSDEGTLDLLNVISAVDVEGFATELISQIVNSDSGKTTGFATVLALIQNDAEEPETECLIIGGDPYELLTPTEVGALLKVSPATARQIIYDGVDGHNQGKIPGRRITARCVRVQRAALDRWLANRQQPELVPQVSEPTGHQPGEMRVYSSRRRKAG